MSNLKTKKMETTYKETHTDEIQFKRYPSQLVNIGWFLLTFAVLILAKVYSVPQTTKVILTAIPGFIWFCRFLIIRCWSFRFHEKTISERKGVFSVHTREVHYSRVKSVRLDEPFWLRIFGLSNVMLITSDPYIRVLRIYAVFNGKEIMEHVKTETSKWRQNRGVGEHDLHPLT